MKIFFTFFCTIFFISFSVRADLINIAAIVNDDVISDYDLEMRMNFIINTSNIPDTESNRQNIKEQVLNMMIDEKLKKQEAARNGISNTDQEIEEALSTIEKQNGMPSGFLQNKLQEIGVPFDTLRDQIDSDLLWVKNSHLSFGHRIKVSDDEVKYRLSMIEEAQSKNQALLADIFLPIEEEDKSSEVYLTAMQILDALHSGSSFSNLARQFSSSITAQNGGDMGWVPEGSLEPELNEGIKNLSIGQVSLPIKTKTGYHLILVRDRKYAEGDKTLDLAKITIPKDYIDKATNFSSLLKEHSSSCEGFIKFGKDIFSEGSGSLGEVSFGLLPEDVQDLLKTLPELTPSDPLISEDKNVYFMICRIAKDEGKDKNLPSFDEVRRLIETERLNILAQRKLRDLRKSAILEKR